MRDSIAEAALVSSITSTRISNSRPLADGDLAYSSTVSSRTASQHFEFASPLDQNAFSTSNVALVWIPHETKFQLGLQAKTLPNIARNDRFTAGSPLGLEVLRTTVYGAPQTIRATA